MMLNKKTKPILVLIALLILFSAAEGTKIYPTAKFHPEDTDWTLNFTSEQRGCFECNKTHCQFNFTTLDKGKFTAGKSGDIGMENGFLALKNYSSTLLRFKTFDSTNCIIRMQPSATYKYRNNNLVAETTSNKNGLIDVGQLQAGWHTIKAIPTPNSPIFNLSNTSYASTYIKWKWDNTPDLDHAMIYLDESFITNTSNPYYNATGLPPDTKHKIAIRTVDKEGNISKIWVIDGAATAPSTPIVTPTPTQRTSGGGGAFMLSSTPTPTTTTTKSTSVPSIPQNSNQDIKENETNTQQNTPTPTPTRVLSEPQITIIGAVSAVSLAVISYVLMRRS